MKITSHIVTLLVLIFFTRPHTAFSQPSNDSTGFFKSLEVGVFVDFYGEYNFNQPLSRTNQLRNFDFRSNRPDLNLAEISLLLPPEPLGFRFDLNYGPKTTNWVHSADPAKSEFNQYFQQAYLSYKTPKGLTIDVGKFVTQHGAEVIETKDNWNYSRSLLFAWAIPYYHVGARAGYLFSSQFTLNAYFVKGWNNLVDNNRGKTLGLQGVWAPHPKMVIVPNFMFGPEQTQNTSRKRFLFDFVVTGSATDKLSLMFNFDYGRDRTGIDEKVFWFGIGGYARYVLRSSWVITPRLEWFNDHDGFTTGQAQSLIEATLTSEFKVVDGLFTRIEYRRDHSDVAFFESNSGKERNQETILFGLFYVFAK